ncbi:MAG: hypothetical protein NVSMB5_10070 [Candidatus Velthaea sp.]
MIASAVVVTIILNGAIVPSFAPARLCRGRVLAPLSSIVARMVTRTVYLPGSHSILIQRSSQQIVVAVAFVADGVPYVPLAPIVHAFGGAAAYDARSHTLSIALDGEREVETPAPFDPGAPQASPTVLFTPEPPKPTPRAVDTGAPRPRRTAIPVVPSQPQPGPT